MRGIREIREIRGIREGRVRRRGGNTFDNMQQNGVLHLPADILKDRSSLPSHFRVV